MWELKTFVPAWKRPWREPGIFTPRWRCREQVQRCSTRSAIESPTLCRLNFELGWSGVGLARLGRFPGRFRALAALPLLLHILSPGKVNQDEIEDSEQYEKNRMGVRVPVHLVYAEYCEDNHGQRVGPEFVHPKKHDEQGFRKPVSDQVNRREYSAAMLERLRPMKQVRDDDLVVFTRQVVQCGDAQGLIHGARLDEPDQNPADAFEQAVKAFDRNSTVKYPVQE